MLTSTNITFLGTSSAVPSSTRNHSSLGLRLDSDVWLFDCGEATQHRVQKSSLKMGKIRKIFVTHMHGDHVFGLVPLLVGIMNGAGGVVGDEEDLRVRAMKGDDDGTKVPLVEIYGPIGTRVYIRTALRTTYSILAGHYIVHELHFSTDIEQREEQFIPPHLSELPGSNIPQSPDGTWQTIYENETTIVHAAPILHSIPCIGYVVSEKPVPGKINKSLYMPHIQRNKDALFAQGVLNALKKLGDLQRGLEVLLPDGTVLQPPEPRSGFKIVILGDTYNPEGIAPIAMDADILIHEATNAHLPEIEHGSLVKLEDTFESVEERTKARGHSTPQMAGKFATRIRAKKLVLNHFSARYAGDDDVNEESALVMRAIANLAQEYFTGDVICARDLMTIDVERPNI